MLPQGSCVTVPLSKRDKIVLHLLLLDKKNKAHLPGLECSRSPSLDAVLLLPYELRVVLRAAFTDALLLSFPTNEPCVLSVASLLLLPHAGVTLDEVFVVVTL